MELKVSNKANVVNYEDVINVVPNHNKLYLLRRLTLFVVENANNYHVWNFLTFCFRVQQCAFTKDYSTIIKTLFEDNHTCALAYFSMKLEVVGNKIFLEKFEVKKTLNLKTYPESKAIVFKTGDTDAWLERITLTQIGLFDCKSSNNMKVVLHFIYYLLHHSAVSV